MLIVTTDSSLISLMSFWVVLELSIF